VKNILPILLKGEPSGCRVALLLEIKNKNQVNILKRKEYFHKKG
jgi:hypothetical protein